MIHHFFEVTANLCGAIEGVRNNYIEHSLEGLRSRMVGESELLISQCDPTASTDLIYWSTRLKSFVTEALKLYRRADNLQKDEILLKSIDDMDMDNIPRDIWHTTRYVLECLLVFLAEIDIEIVENNRELYDEIVFDNTLRGEYGRRIKLLEQKLSYAPNSTTAKSDSPLNYSALEWATIFYFVRESGYLDKEKTLNDQLSEFHRKHGIKNTTTALRSRYYEAKKNLNETQTYSIKKLQKISDFIEMYYPNASRVLSGDISLLRDSQEE